MLALQRQAVIMVHQSAKTVEEATEVATRVAVTVAMETVHTEIGDMIVGMTEVIVEADMTAAMGVIAMMIDVVAVATMIAEAVAAADMMIAVEAAVDMEVVAVVETAIMTAVHHEKKSAGKDSVVKKIKA